MKPSSSPLDDNHARCKTCNQVLTGKRRKWCSLYCKNRHTNRKYQTYVCQQQRGHERKIELIKLSGGVCKKCGYKKNNAALSFHHLDPSTKKFGLDIRACSNRKWSVLLEEVAKCELLCLNCHAETHHPVFLV